jgi:hypothetical protein
MWPLRLIVPHVSHIPRAIKSHRSPYNLYLAVFKICLTKERLTFRFKLGMVLSSQTKIGCTDFDDLG